MAYLLDTSIAIPLRDGHRATLDRAAPLVAAISIITHVELEGGVCRFPRFMAKRRAGLDTLLTGIVVLPFADAEVRAYRAIVEAIGYSRRLVIDRMIAATALVHGLTLITSNAGDFGAIPDLLVEGWPAVPGDTA